MDETKGKIIIDGGREILRAAEAGCQVTEVFLCPQWCEAADSEPLWQQVVDRSLPIVSVTETIMQRLAYGDRTDGLVAVATAPDPGLAVLPVHDRAG